MGEFKNSKTTLKHIAEKTGYSVNTVSRALRGKDDIAKETKESIMQVADELGYVNNMLASSLRLGYTKTIAVILGDVSNPHFSILMKEIEEQARAYDYSSFLINTNEEEELEEKAIRDAINKNVDGIIICPTQRSKRNILTLQSRNIPFVLLGRHYPELDTDYVVCNDELGGYQATKHLLDKGHRRILFLNGPHYISSAEERLNGYIRAYEESGIGYDESLVHEIPTDTRMREEAFQTILKDRSQFTAIFAFNDVMAWEAWSLLYENGVSVPRDCSIIGFDHIQSKLALPYRLSTISSYKTRMSTLAVDLLVSRMKGDDIEGQENHVVIDTRLVVGETVLDVGVQ